VGSYHRILQTFYEGKNNIWRLSTFFGKLWRTGANSATKVTFSDAATVGTTELAKGTYAIYTIPNPND
jgi:hypothetical protein